MVTRYRKKPVVITAIQLTCENFNEVEEFLGITASNRYFRNEVDFLKKTNPCGIYINTLEGTMLADINDYVIKGVKGEFYPCKPEIFEMSYDIE